MRGVGVVLMALLVGVISMIPGVRAYADTVSAVDPDSITIESAKGDGNPVYVWEDLVLTAKWRIPDNSGQAGQQFTLALPEPFSLKTGEFELKGVGNDTLTYGTCAAVDRELTCTLNGNVVGKTQVHGTLTLNFSSNKTYDQGTVNVSVNGQDKSVPLPPANNTGIGYNPSFPDNVGKSGWVDSNNPKRVKWLIRFPGRDFTDRSKVTVADTFAVNGIDLSVVPDSVTVYKLVSSAKCWNENRDPACYIELYPNKDVNYKGNPKITVDIQDGKFTTDIDLQTQNFSDQHMYIVEVELESKEDIPVGAELVNKADVGGKATEGVITRDMTGSGTGSGLDGSVGHISLKKNVAGGNFAAADFPVKYSYEVKGTLKEGTLILKGDGTPVSLANIPHGTRVALAEDVAALPAGVTFQDPVFSGDNVADGGANSPAATVEVTGGGKTTEVTLTNTVQEDKVATPVDPVVTAGVCAPGATKPSDPTVKVAQTEGITYGQPKITTAGDKATVTVVATLEAGYTFPANLPAGWTLNQDGTATYTKTVNVPTCELPKVAVVSPTLTAGTCAPGATKPSDPTVNVSQTPGITYGQPDIKVADGKATVTLVATPDADKRIDSDALPAGWAMNPDGRTATFTGEVQQPKCEVEVTPVNPEVEEGVCVPGSATPSDPTVKVAQTKGITYGQPKITTAGDKATVTVTATLEAGYTFPANLPAGWVMNQDGTATFTKTVNVPPCGPGVVSPVDPVVNAGTCAPGATTPSDPTVNVPQTKGITYGQPKITTAGDKATVTVTATLEAGYKFPANLPAGWTLNQDGTATFTKTVNVPSCGPGVVSPIDPVVNAGTCAPGATTPSDPTVELAQTKGIKYGDPVIKTADGKVTVTVDATLEAGYTFPDNLPAGWVKNQDGTATYTKTMDVSACQGVPVTPVSPKITPGVCVPGSKTPSAPKVEIPKVPGLTYGDPKIQVVGRKVVITVQATPDSGYSVNASDMPAGWTLNQDGSATFTLVADQPVCSTPVKPRMPKTGANGLEALLRLFAQA